MSTEEELGVFDAHSYICRRDLNLELDLCFFCSCCCHRIFFRIVRFVVLAGGFVFVLFFCFCMDWLEVEGVKDLISRRDKEDAF